LDEETQRELNRKKLCFTRKDPSEPSHICMGKGKVLSNGADNEETGHVLGEVHDSPEEEQPCSEGESPREEPKKVFIDTLSGVPKYYTFRIRGFVHGYRITTLIDGGATHNFIDTTLADMKGIPT
jgi:hypothetical protein